MDFNIFLFASSRESDAEEAGSFGVEDEAKREEGTGVVVDMITVVALSLAWFSCMI